MTVDLDGCSKEVKLAVMHVLGGNKTGAVEYYPVTMPSLPQIPGIYIYIYIYIYIIYIYIYLYINLIEILACLVFLFLVFFSF